MSESTPKRFPDRYDIAVVREEADALETGEEGAETAPARGTRDGAPRHGEARLPRPRRPQRAHPAARAETRTGVIDVHLGDVVGAIGKPTKSRRGEPSLILDELVLLSRNRSPLPDTHHGLTDIEQRYRRRYLDLLMNEDVRADFILRARIVNAVRSYLDREGFIEVETPILVPRYGGAFAEPFVTPITTCSTRISTCVSRPSCT